MSPLTSNFNKLLLILLILIIIGVIIPYTTLSITIVSTNDILIEKILFKDSSFKMKWIHSVELTPWEESFLVTKNKIYLESTRFQSFGAGVPDAIGDATSTENGYVTYSGIHKDMPNLIYGISPIAKHELEIGSVNPVIYKLYELVPADTAVSFEAEYASLLVRQLNKLK